MAILRWWSCVTFVMQFHAWRKAPVRNRQFDFGCHETMKKQGYQYLIRHLIIRPRGYRSREIGIIISLWNLTGASVALQPRQIAEWLDNSKHKSHGFKTSRDLAKYIETALSQPCRWRHAVPQVGKPQPCDLSTFHLCVSLSLARGRARASLSFTYRLICIGQLPYWSFIRRIAARTPRAPMETSTIATCTCTGADGVPDAAACGGIEVAIDDTNALPSPFVASQQVWGRVTCWAVCARHMEHWAAVFCQSFTVIHVDC